MAVAPAVTTFVPVEVYLRSDYEPDAEYVDGVIEERPMGVYDHGSWQRAILKWFLLHEEEWNVRIIPELRVQVTATRYRVPDVTLVDHARPIEQILTYPPIAVFEVLSPEDGMTRVLVKLDDYERMGIRHIFVINPKIEGLHRYRNGNLDSLALEVCTLEPGPCSIDWRTVTSYLV